MPVDYETKIFSIATASREFLTIVIGLALSYAIATRASEIPGIKTGELETIWCSQVGAVFVYILYASRFFVNNWLYLSESYDEKRLRDLKLNDNESKAKLVLARAYFDMVLTIYSAIIISIAALFGLAWSDKLTDRQWHGIALWLMWCLLAHYLIDGVVLIFTTALRNDTTPLNRLRGFLWVINNYAFVVVVLIEWPDLRYDWLLWALFINCTVAILITMLSPPLVSFAVKRKWQWAIADAKAAA